MRHMQIMALALAAALLCGGCNLWGGGKGFSSHTAQTERQALEAQLDMQLGLLAPKITAGERAACMEIWENLYPLREKRRSDGRYEKSERELRLLKRLNKLLDAYTISYLDGNAEGFGYEYPPEQDVAEYRLDGGNLMSNQRGSASSADKWSEQVPETLWRGMEAILPPGAFRDFSKFKVFTDGPLETVAYVEAADAAGTQWIIAVDPEDVNDGDSFTETVLHEYFHYLSLNATQADYTRHQTTGTYNEPGMVSKKGSYLDDFYQKFWTGYIDDCLTSDDTYNFFLRHYDDFVSGYASTSPSEDICESFTYFILYDREPRPGDVWEKKLDFFYEYPELVAFRETVRAGLE